MWGEVVSNCTYLPLLNLTYPLKPVYRVGDSVFITPVYSGYADSWAASPHLPSSVHLDERTGVLRGAFSAALEGEFTITASNQRESTAVILHCRIRDTTRVTLQVVPLSHAPRSSDNPLGRILSTEGNQIREGSTVPSFGSSLPHIHARCLFQCGHRSAHPSIPRRSRRLLLSTQNALRASPGHGYGNHFREVH